MPPGYHQHLSTAIQANHQQSITSHSCTAASMPSFAILHHTSQILPLHLVQISPFMWFCKVHISSISFLMMPSDIMLQTLLNCFQGCMHHPSMGQHEAILLLKNIKAVSAGGCSLLYSQCLREILSKINCVCSLRLPYASSGCHLLHYLYVGRFLNDFMLRFD